MLVGDLMNAHRAFCGEPSLCRLYIFMFWGVRLYKYPHDPGCEAHSKLRVWFSNLDLYTHLEHSLHAKTNARVAFFFVLFDLLFLSTWW